MSHGELQRPFVHLNGTSGDVLVESYVKAMRKCQDALKALEYAAPNVRDYYPMGDTAFTKARAEHRVRVAMIESVHSDLAALAEHCSDAAHPRRVG